MTDHRGPCACACHVPTPATRLYALDVEVLGAGRGIVHVLARSGSHARSVVVARCREIARETHTSEAMVVIHGHDEITCGDATPEVE